MKIKYLLSFLSVLSFVCTWQSEAQEIKQIGNLSKDLGTMEFRLMDFAEMGGNLYLTTWSNAGTHLWKTDGNSTILVYQWPDATIKANNYAVNKLYAYKNSLLLTGFDSTHGNELWISDGTRSGTHLLKDIYPGATGAFAGNPVVSFYFKSDLNYTPFAEIHGKMCFMAFGPSRFSELWETDGTSSGTRQIQVFNPVPTYGMGSNVGTINNKYIVSGIEGPNSSGSYLSDGTVSGTSLMATNQTFQDFFRFNGKLLFNEVDNRSIGVSDGTIAGSFPIAMNMGISADRVELNNRLYFFNISDRTQLFSTDGTSSGTWAVKDSIKVPNTERFIRIDNHKHYPVAMGNSIYFCGQNEIWKSDGTRAGTQIVKSFPVNPNYGMPAHPSVMVAAGNKLYFKAWDVDKFRFELFVSDGTQSGTAKLTHPLTNYNDSFFFIGGILFTHHPNEQMIVFNNKLIFTQLYDTAVGKALYKIDLSNVSVGPEIQKTESLIVSPNPASTELKLTYSPGIFETATILDVLGRSIRQRAINKGGSDALNLSDVAPGRYFIQLNGPGKTISTPVIISR